MRASKIAAAAAVLAIATGGTVATTANAAPAAHAAAGTTLHLTASTSMLMFNTKSLKAKAGKVTIILSNPSSIPHAIALSGKGVKKVGKTVGKGGKSTISATLKKGKYTFYCPVPGHEAAGMKGTLTVS
jgi:uncharacterized cupredoxin-like copper-binding protein